MDPEPGLVFAPLWPVPLVTPTLSRPGLGIHGEDSILSVRCPVYGGANARSVYFCAATDLSFSWEGGDVYEAAVEEWAQDQYLQERRRWRAAAVAAGFADDPTAARYSMDAPFGGRAGGGHMLHAGGLMLLLFPGLAVEVPEGFQFVVGPATNFRYSPGWTVQHGAFAHGYEGELSLNVQVLRQGRYRIPAGTPMASGMLVREEAPAFRIRTAGDVDAFYLRKAARLRASGG